MSKNAYKQQGNVGLFDTEMNMAKLNSKGNPLEKLVKVIDFEMFRETLETALFKKKMTNSGAKPYDYVMMFKILVLQRFYHLSNEQTEYQIIDRLSFRNFLGLSSGDRIPDENTIWLFKEQLTKLNLFEKLFDKFYKMLEDKELIMNEGVMVDGSFVEVPRQRNSRAENAEIKEGRGDGLWTSDDERNKRIHKDTDARWTVKNNQNHYGYKNHVNVDAKSKFIKKGITTDASVHDSKATEKLITPKDKGQPFFADSAYVGAAVKKILRRNGMKDRIIKRNTKNKKISRRQETINKRNSKVRVRVEHVFGFCEQNLRGMYSRAVGFLRNAAFNTLTNLVYNMARYEQVMRLGMN